MIHYLTGDATNPKSTGGPRFILHVCNNQGGWGRGFVLALSKRWPEPEREYRRWYRNGADLLAGTFQLGAIQQVPVQGDPPLTVVNMIAQRGYGKGNQNKHRTSEPDSAIPLSYEHLEVCLLLFADGLPKDATIHMPRIGCGLAGGTWDKVEPIVANALKAHEVYVYDL